MTVLVALLYLLLLTWLVTKTPFFTNSGLSRWQLAAIFITKAAIASFYGFYFSRGELFLTGDTWKFYSDSLPHTDMLLKNPLLFVQDLFTHGYEERGAFFYANNSYWNDLKTNLFLKTLAVINLLTFRNYYANAFVLNYVFLFGCLAVYRLFINDGWKNSKALLVFTVCLTPSFAFWYSGLHKDGLIFTSLGLLVYFAHKLRYNKLPLAQIALSIFCLLLLFGYKNFIALVFIPFAAAAIMLNRKRNIFFFYTALFILLIVADITGLFSFSHIIATKQNEFFSLEGSSQITNLPVLKASITSLGSYFPYAIDNVFFQPHIQFVTGSMQAISFVENIAVFLCILLLLARAKHLSGFQLALLFFIVSYLLIVGYTVTLSGAIMRYKSLVYPLLIPLCLYHINFTYMYDFIIRPSRKTARS